jgi:hypothetical protein
MSGGTMGTMYLLITVEIISSFSSASVIEEMKAREIICDLEISMIVSF